MDSVEDRIIARRWVDAEGQPVEKVGGVWCHPETGVRANPVTLQVIRESAWTSEPEEEQ